MLANLGAFVPARSAVPLVQLSITADVVSGAVCDLYTAARESLPVAAFDGDPAGCVVELEAAGAAGLEKAARADRKGFGWLEWHPGDCVRFLPEYGVVATAKDVTGAVGQFANPGLWDAVADLFVRLDCDPRELPRTVALNPDYVARLGKIRLPRGHAPIADFSFHDPHRAVLVKIGPTFQAAIMPIDPAVPVANGLAEPGALW